MNVHWLQDKLKHQHPKPKGKKVNRPQATKRNHVYQSKAAPGRGGGKKCGRQYSKVIGNPALKYAGAGVIWNQV
jgi:hypothetical protein